MDHQHQASDVVRKRRRSSGVISVEFALALPILMALLFGIVEFGQAFHKQQILTAAVLEGAKFGAASTDPRPSQGAILSKVQFYLDQAGLVGDSAVVTVTGAGGPPGSELKVSVAYPSDFAMMAAMGIAEAGQHSLTAELVAEIN